MNEERERVRCRNCELTQWGDRALCRRCGDGLPSGLTKSDPVVLTKSDPEQEQRMDV
jgi:hypothetical protein